MGTFLMGGYAYAVKQGVEVDPLKVIIVLSMVIICVVASEKREK